MQLARKFAVIVLVLVTAFVSCGSGTAEGAAESESSSGSQEQGQEQEQGASQAGEDADRQSRRDAEMDASAREQALDFQEIFREVAREVAPVVVQVNVVDVVSGRTPQTPFDFFFGPREDDGEEREFRREGLGSGVIVRREGDTTYAVTNAHVVAEVEEVSVVLDDEREFEADIVGTDQRLDLALLEFEASGDVPVAEFGDSNELQVGDWVIAIGNPLGFQSTVTAGIVSALGRSAPAQGGGMGNLSDFIQTDAAINPGNSGGALANLNGEIIGINTWIASQSGGSVGIGFAIPANNVTKAVEDFVEEGRITYGWLGVSIADADPRAYPDIREDLELGDRDGAMVFNVYEGSPAEQDGILPGDFIVAADGEEIEDADHLTRVVGNLTPDETMEFELIRYGNRRNVTVNISQRRAETELEQQQNRVWPGMFVMNVTEEIAEQLELESGDEGVVVRAVIEGSPAAQSGVRQGDLVTEVNGRPVGAMQEFFRALNEADGRGSELSILRGEQSIERRITP
ncbi:MAG: Do family serine endopeptidase [Spirochaetaceae bacterium]